MRPGGITLHAGRRVERIDVRAKQVVAGDGLVGAIRQARYRDRQQPRHPASRQRARRARHLQTGRVRVPHAGRLRAHHALRRDRAQGRGDRRRAAGTGGGPRSAELGSRDARDPPDAAPDGGAARSGRGRSASTPVRTDGPLDTPCHADDRRPGQRACRGSRIRRWQPARIATWS